MHRFVRPGFVLILLTVNLWLVSPLLSPGESPYRDSIGPGYASMAAFFRDHPSPWGWNPNQYGGHPAEATYLPVVPYLAAWMSGLACFENVIHATRVLFLFAGCLVPVAWFLYASQAGGMRPVLSFFAMLAYTLVSPEYGLFGAVDGDRGLAYLPWRLQVVAKYGEGPHTLGLALAPLALLAFRRVAGVQGLSALVPAAAIYAIIALTNWVAALSLAILTVIVLMLEFVPRGIVVTGRTVVTALLAYVMAAFWLTPTLIANTLSNWPRDAFGYRFEGKQQMLILACVAGGLLLGWFLRWQQSQAALYGSALYLFGFVTTVFYATGINVIPESRRYAPEFSLFLFLTLGAVLSSLHIRSRRTSIALGVAAAALILVGGRCQLWSVLSGEHRRLASIPSESTVECRIARWLTGRQPRGRVFVSGGTRFRWNAWTSIPQVGGVFESGLENRIPLDLIYQIRTALGSEPSQAGRDALVQLQALGVEYLVIHGSGSREHYQDFGDADRMKPLLEAVYQDNADVVYRVPFRALAHAVRHDEIVSAYHGGAPRTIDRFASAVVDQGRPSLDVRFDSNERLSIRGDVRAHQPVAVLISQHAGWRAFQCGRNIPIRRDALGFMSVLPWCDSADIVLMYSAGVEQRIVAGVSALAWLGAGGIWFWIRTRRNETGKAEHSVALG